MSKVLSYETIENDIENIKARGSLVLVGGCFDVLHPGHIFFLNEAKKQGDTLVVMLEGDQSIRKRKGKDRPVNTTRKRIETLLDLKTVDYVLPLPHLKTDLEYSALVKIFEPDIIAMTVGDPAYNKKVEQAKTVKGKVFEIKMLPEYSTTKLIKI